MSALMLVIVLLEITSVVSDGGCDCSALSFLKQIVQQEIFERKLEFSMLRSELQTGPRSIESSSMKDPDIINRVEKLEQLVAVLKNTSDVEQQEDVENHVEKDNPKTYVNNEEKLFFQAIVKQALKNEKLERINFISQVQTQIDNLNGIVSDFKTNTDNFVNEQALKWSADNEQFEKNITQQFSEFRASLAESLQDHEMQMTTGMDKISEDIKQFDKNTSNEFESLKANIHSDRETDKAHIKAFLNRIIDNVTDVREGVNECDTAIGLHTADMKQMKENIENSLNVVEELKQRFGEHLKGSEQRFSVIAEKVGACRNVNGDGEWKHHGNRCYHYSDGISKSWFDASETCKKLNGGLVKIGSKEENDYITANIKTSHWIGFHDTHKENVWQWISDEGTAESAGFGKWASNVWQWISDEGTAESGGFRNWAKNEPNDAHANEDCATILPEGKWNDFICSKSLPFICEKDPVLI